MDTGRALAGLRTGSFRPVGPVNSWGDPGNECSSDRLYKQMQGLGAVESGIEIALQRVGGIDGQLRVAAKKDAQGDPCLQAGQGGAYAKVDALAKPDVGVRLAVHDEIVGILELPFVVVRGEYPGHDQLLGRDGLTTQLDLGRGR